MNAIPSRASTSAKSPPSRPTPRRGLLLASLCESALPWHTCLMAANNPRGNRANRHSSGSLIFLALSILVVLHFRRRRQDKREDMEERFQPSDYGLDDIPSTTRKKQFAASADDISTATSPSGHPRRSRDPLQSAIDLKSPPPGHHGNGYGNGYLNPFDDASSFRSGTGSSYPPSRRGEK